MQKYPLLKDHGEVATNVGPAIFSVSPGRMQPAWGKTRLYWAGGSAPSPVCFYEYEAAVQYLDATIATTGPDGPLVEQDAARIVVALGGSSQGPQVSPWNAMQQRHGRAVWAESSVEAMRIARELGWR